MRVSTSARHFDFLSFSFRCDALRRRCSLKNRDSVSEGGWEQGGRDRFHDDRHSDPWDAIESHRLFKYPLETREVFALSFCAGDTGIVGRASAGQGRDSGKHEEGGGGSGRGWMKMGTGTRRWRRRGTTVVGGRMAGLAWKIETGSIVTALMPLFLPITPLRPLRAHNDTLNGRPEGNGAVSSRDPCAFAFFLSRNTTERGDARQRHCLVSLSLSLSESIPLDIPLVHRDYTSAFSKCAARRDSRTTSSLVET